MLFVKVIQTEMTHCVPSTRMKKIPAVIQNLKFQNRAKEQWEEVTWKAWEIQMVSGECSSHIVEPEDNGKMLPNSESV